VPVLCEARNWEVAATLSDLDASAYQPRARRPGFETLISEAAARSAEDVLVWKLDRLVRRPKDFERLWAVAERRGVFIASVTEPVDNSSPIGLAMLRILVALAGLESATTGIRVRASKRQAAEEVRPPPVKAYGLTPQWDAIVGCEAAVLREAARRAIGGERLAWVARDLRSRGIPAPTGRQWTDATLGRLYATPGLWATALQRTGRRPGLLASDRGSRHVRSAATDAQSPGSPGCPASTPKAARDRVRPVWFV
jgi:DNA invertase Pin-like site-specific DNA recombinase